MRALSSRISLLIQCHFFFVPLSLICSVRIPAMSLEGHPYSRDRVITGPGEMICRSRSFSRSMAYRVGFIFCMLVTSFFRRYNVTKKQDISKKETGKIVREKGKMRKLLELFSILVISQRFKTKPKDHDRTDQEVLTGIHAGQVDSFGAGLIVHFRGILL